MRAKADIIRDCFKAYNTKNRAMIESLLADDLRFTSPYDDAIDRAVYFERCWPNAGRIREHIVEEIMEEGDRAFVTYKCVTNEGKTFRNTEFFTFEGDKVKSVHVFFGETYIDGKFVAQEG